MPSMYTTLLVESGFLFSHYTGPTHYGYESFNLTVTASARHLGAFWMRKSVCVWGSQVWQENIRLENTSEQFVDACFSVNEMYTILVRIN